MQKIKLYSKLWVLFVLISVFGANQSAIANSGDSIVISDCIHYGTVYDYTGLDGCGFVIQKDDGQILEIAEITSNILLEDSMRVIFGYTPLRDVGSICMVGQPVRVECIEPIPGDYCKADFYYEKIRCEILSSDMRCGVGTYAFFDRSIGNGIIYHWDFGDGTYSDEQNPIHHFEEDGVYQVLLRIDTEGGCISRMLKKVIVGSGTTDPCDARILYKQLYPDSLFLEDSLTDIYYSPYTYQFYDVSEGEVIERTWYFSDGFVTEEENPLHTFEAPGIYQVCLKILTADDCIDEVCVTIVINDPGECLALFEYYPIDYLMNPSVDTTFWPTPGFLYQFNDISKGDVVYRLWTIGPDTIFNDPSPLYEFPESGSYKVSLEIETSDGCASRTIQVIQIGDTNLCTARFEYYPVDSSYWGPEGDVYGTTIQFYDRSEGFVVERLWDFGDGEISSETDPQHTYESAGSYPVCLTIVTEDGCEDQYCLWITVGYTGDCHAYFEYCEYHPVNEDEIYYDSVWYIGFKNMSKGRISSYLWDFGDGNYSDLKNPVHEYYTSGLYTVCLTVWNEAGCQDEYCATVNVGDVNCEVDFTYNMIYPDCSNFDPAYVFTPVTNRYDLSYYWSFGDGEYSYDREPIHIFPEYGKYEVCLEINTWNGCTSQVCNLIWFNSDAADSVYLEKCSTTSIGNYQMNSGLSVTSVFPNPAKEVFTIVLLSNKAQSVSLSLVNVLGQQFDMKSVYQLNEGENRISIQTDQMQTGNYYYIIKGNDQIVRGSVTVVD